MAVHVDCIHADMSLYYRVLQFYERLTDEDFERRLQNVNPDSLAFMLPASQKVPLLKEMIMYGAKREHLFQAMQVLPYDESYQEECLERYRKLRQEMRQASSRKSKLIAKRLFAMINAMQDATDCYVGELMDLKDVYVRILDTERQKWEVKQQSPDGSAKIVKFLDFYTEAITETMPSGKSYLHNFSDYQYNRFIERLLEANPGFELFNVPTPLSQGMTINPYNRTLSVNSYFGFPFSMEWTTYLYKKGARPFLSLQELNDQQTKYIKAMQDFIKKNEGNPEEVKVTENMIELVKSKYLPMVKLMRRTEEKQKQVVENLTKKERKLIYNRSLQMFFMGSANEIAKFFDKNKLVLPEEHWRRLYNGIMKRRELQIHRLVDSEEGILYALDNVNDLRESKYVPQMVNMEEASDSVKEMYQKKRSDLMMEEMD